MATRTNPLAPRPASLSIVWFWCCLATLGLGLIMMLTWHEASYCRRNPRSGPNMKVDEPCYLILAKTSAVEGVLADIGGYLAVGGALGAVIAAGFFIRSAAR